MQRTATPTEGLPPALAEQAREIERVATHVLVLHEGHTVVAGSVSDLLGRYHARVRLLVDEPQVARHIIEDAPEKVQILEADHGNFVLSMAVEQVPVLNRHLVEAGVTVRTIMPIRSLEEYFLSII